jgi:hypothetical protein
MTPEHMARLGESYKRVSADYTELHNSTALSLRERATVWLVGAEICERLDTLIELLKPRENRDGGH